MKFIVKIAKLTLSAVFFLTIARISAQEITINQEFSSDTVIMPFTGTTPVYSVKFSGSVNLLSDSSLVRIVLIDYHGNHYLIYEAYPLITHDSAFSVTEVCDETCYLNGIVPDSIRVDIVNAFLNLNTLILSTEYISNAEQLQAQAKWENDSVMISIMNQRIQEEHMYWRAGRTLLSGLTFSEKEQRFCKKYNTEGYDYYKGGIYQKNSSKTGNLSTNEVVEEFDWRNRHHADLTDSHYYDGDPNPVQGNRSGWSTIPRHQGDCKSCMSFTAIAQIEAYANLFFNNNIGNPNTGVLHHVDVDLSELQVMRCVNTPSPCNTNYSGGTASIYNYVINNLIQNEECFPYYLATGNPPCTTFCNPPSELMKISNASWFEENNVDYIKKLLIKFGPLAIDFPDYFGPGDGHMMLLVGYGINKAGDTVYHGTGESDPPIIIDNLGSVDENITWIFKDSNIGDWLHYTQDLLSNISLANSRYILGEVFRETTTNIKCSDEDGDGYYWWGIHWEWVNGQGAQQVSPQDCNCPPGIIPEDEDCNDWDNTAGPYDQQTYECQDISNNCITNGTPHTVAQTERWDDVSHWNQNVIIPGGHTLTVVANAFFSPDAKIIVLPGGRLEVHGTSSFNATLSSSCHSLWGGIEVHGDPKESQSLVNGFDEYHGVVDIQYGAIENAECGIRVANPGYDPDYCSSEPPEFYYPSGGIVQVKNSTLRNNKTGIDFYPYRNFDNTHPVKDNLSLLAGNRFLTDLSLLDTHVPDYFIKLSGVDGIKIVGCTFENLNYDPPVWGPDYPGRGRGIYCYNADLYVHDTTGYDSKFENLEYGVYAIHTGYNRSYVSLKGSTFNGNRSSAYFSGYSETNLFNLTGNEFNYTHNFTSSSPETTKIYGLYLNNCSGYRVSLNTFDAGGFNGNGILFGALINNSGFRTNFIYKNDFAGLDYALQSQNQNHGAGYLPDKLGQGQIVYPVETGLCFKCNDFINCGNDIIITEDEQNPPVGSGIVRYQGTDKGENSPTAKMEPAGNTFSPLVTGHFDMNINSDVDNIIYTHHLINPAYRVIPDKDYINNNYKVTIQQHRSAQANYNSNESCPEVNQIFDCDTLKIILNEARARIDSLSALLYELIDDGSTETKNSMVLNSTPDQSVEVYTDLMSVSPYLSDTVMKNAIEKETVLSNALISNIMVSNPQSAKNDDILAALDDRITPLCDSAWSEIMKGVDSVASRELLETELSGWISIKEQRINDLIKVYMTDTVNSWAPDSLVSLLKYDPVLASQYKLVNYFIDFRDFASVDSLLNYIPVHYTLDEKAEETNQKYISILPSLEELYNDTSGFILPDSIHQVLLHEIAVSDEDVPGSLARNILIAAGLMSYEEPVFLSSELKSGRNYLSKSKKQISETVMKVYPNPCTEYLTVEYLIKEKFNHLQLTIKNLENTNLYSQSLSRRQDLLVLSTKEFNPGIYFIQIRKDGKTLETKKIIIIK